MLELLIRMIGAKSLRNYLRDGWNLFDLIIVVLSLIPFDLLFAGGGGLGQAVLALRVFRMIRVMRLIQGRPQLRRIIDTVFKTIPVIIDIAILLVIILYIYSVIGSFLFKGDDWQNVFSSMLVMFSVLVVDGWNEINRGLMPENPYLALGGHLREGGNFLNFHGLTQLTASLWPFLALVYLGATSRTQRDG